MPLLQKSPETTRGGAGCEGAAVPRAWIRDRHPAAGPGRTNTLLFTLWRAFMAAILIWGMSVWGGAGEAAAAARSTPGTLRLVVNGNVIEPDVPPMITEGRTLVPVRVVSENLGASVRWNAASRQVVVGMNGREVVLGIGQKQATVNGVNKDLDVPARLVEGRTMVPLRFIGEALGASVAWEESTRTVRVDGTRLAGIRWQKGSDRARLILDVTGPVDFIAASLDGSSEGPPRIVVDLKPATVGLPEPVIPIFDGNVLQVRTEQLSANPDVARVWIDLTEPVRYRAHAEDRSIYVDIDYKVARVTHQNRPEGEVVVIENTGPVSFTARQMGDPERLVIDLVGVTVGQGVSTEIPGTGGLVQRVRVSQFRVNPDEVRVVLDLTHRAAYEVKPEGNVLTVYFRAQVTGVSWQSFPEGRRLVIQATQPVTSTVLYLSDPHRLVVDIDNAYLLAPREIDTGDEVIRKVVMSQFQANPPVVRVVAHLSSYLVHLPVSGGAGPGSPAGQTIVDILISPTARKRVVIDPGHGGSDPGAIGPRGTREKDVNLAIALLLKEMLEQRGIQVMMTRTADMTVDLFWRPQFANQVGADVFVSVHANSYLSDTKSGTETYHFTNHPESRRLAQYLQTELLALGLPDRGVREERFVVLKEAVMPAALVEVAFLSNPEEERLLIDPAFRRRAAEAIAKGIVRFLER